MVTNSTELRKVRKKTSEHIPIHFSDGWHKCVKTLCITQLISMIFYFGALPFIIRFINESSLDDLKGYGIWLGGIVGSWSLGYFSPNISFIPRK